MELLIAMMAALALMMFFGMRKQKRVAQATQELQSSLSEGDRVMTTSGMYATVADASDDTTIDLEIADGMVTTWLRQAVREKVGPEIDDEDYEETDELESAETDESAESAESDDDKNRSGAQVAPPLEHGSK
ncbi:MAG: preprotein translocase subunit YajC [Actinophytocola sp.]|nr:preprotein translocase subunit YajC [Actinophytocola sp.]